MKYLFIVLAICSFSLLKAQNPVEYMKKINADNEQIMQNNWKYLSAVARSKSPSKVASMRRNLEASLKESLRNLNAAGSYNGNDDYRQASIAYQKFSLDLVTGKSAELVDLEKISQTSYDNLEAYVKFQRELNKLSKQEADKINQAQEAFAKANNVNLVEGEQNELMSKIEEGSKVLSYQEDMMLVYMRCSMYEMDMLSRINTDEPYNFAQAGITLLDLVDQSKKSMNDIKDINSDTSLRQATTNALNLYEEEAQTLIPALSEYRKAENDFKSAQKQIESMPENKRTKEVVEAYNAKAANMNELSANFGKLLNEFNQKREQSFNAWNQASEQFVNKYMPAE